MRFAISQAVFQLVGVPSRGRTRLFPTTSRLTIGCRPVSVQRMRPFIEYGRTDLYRTNVTFASQHTITIYSTNPSSISALRPPDRKPQPQEEEVVLKTMWDRITDATSVGVAWSILIHTFFLIAMALVILPSVGDDGGVAVDVTDADNDVTTFDNIADLKFETAGAADSSMEEVALVSPDPADIPLAVATIAKPKAATESSGAGQGKTEGEGKGAPRLRAPKNAVRRGRFSAWTIPISQYRGDNPSPGDSPRPGQHYHIVIQLELPESLRRYSVGDLTGSVVGTDGYRLQLPNRTYFFNDEGNLEQATARRRLPIVDRKVQILVHVPGAKYAAVKDKIAVSSRRLVESQTIELVFKQDDNLKPFFK